MNKIYSFAKIILEKLAVNGLWQVICAISAGVIYWMKIVSFSMLEIILVFIVILFLLGFAFYQFYWRKRSDVVDIQQEEPSVKVLDSYYSIDFSQGDKIIHHRKKTLVALKDNVTEYTDTLYSKNLMTNAKSGPGPYWIDFIAKKDSVTTVYRFVFNQPLMKGDKIVLEAIWKGGSLSSDLMIAPIEEQTNSLTMRVKLDKKRNTALVLGHEHPYVGSKTFEKVVQGPPNAAGEFIWIVSSPKILKQYNLTWVC